MPKKYGYTSKGTGMSNAKRPKKKKSTPKRRKR